MDERAHSGPGRPRGRTGGVHRALTVWVAGVAFLAAAPAGAQTVTNTRTSVTYTTLSAAIADAAPDDALEVSGTLVENVVVDRNLTLLGLPGATLQQSAGSLIEVAASVDVVIDGFHLDGTGTRGILATGDNQVVVQNTTFTTGDPAASFDGGGLHATDPRLVMLQNVSFAGSNTVWAARGGAVFVTASATAPLVLEDVSFERVRASGQGGGLWTHNVAITCTRCRFESTHGSFGGGIYASLGTLTLMRSFFCDNQAGLGGGIFASSDAEIRSTVFVEAGAGVNGAAVFANGGDWRLVNNHVLGMSGSSAVYIPALANPIVVTNNLFLENAGTALFVGDPNPPVGYNWFSQNTTDANFALAATNYVGQGDPLLLEWNRDGNCTNDQLWPTPFQSPLLDAGNPAIPDPDAGRSDIGAFGGPTADPVYFADGDGDGQPFLVDCDDAVPDVYQGAPELCDGVDNDCDGFVDNDSIDIDAFHEDCDTDGQGTPVASFVQCFAPIDPPICGGDWLSAVADGAAASSDCDDTDPDTYLGAPESCDPGDQNCDGDPDLGAVDGFTYFADGDGDGFGAAPLETCAAVAPPGYVLVGGDCADGDPAVLPGAPDACGDGVDQDCSGADGPAGEPCATPVPVMPPGGMALLAAVLLGYGIARARGRHPLA